jgi:hypothetical protein
VREVARVLAPAGRFAIATLHPANTAADVGGYHESRRYDIAIERDGLRMVFSSLHHPLERYFAWLRDAGFVVEDLREIRIGDAPAPDLLHLLARTS